ncbi:MAG: pseudouridine synthase [Phycisphaerae bacterium]
MAVRLQKYMADCGVASRRECEDMIRLGRVKVNGSVVTTLPVLITPEKDRVTLDEAELENLKPEKLVYLLVNKPKGILVTRADPEDRKTIYELLKGIPQRVFPVGRLDMDSRGLLIMTNDGELSNRLTHPRYGVSKTYVVSVEGRIGEAGVEQLKKGIWLAPKHGKGAANRTEGFKVKILGREAGLTLLQIKLTESRNAEIRRVLANLGYRVRDINRVTLAERLHLGAIKPGQYRELTTTEVAWLYNVTSPQYRNAQTEATQTWYEQKEMDKERRRLESPNPEAVASPAKPKKYAPPQARSRTGQAVTVIRKAPGRDEARGPARDAERRLEREPSRDSVRGPARDSARGPTRGPTRRPFARNAPGHKPYGGSNNRRPSRGA